MKRTVPDMWKMQAKEDAPDELNLYIYGDVEALEWEDDGTFWGRVKTAEASAKRFREELTEYSDVKRINVYINSKGGSVYEGTAIYNQLKRHPAIKTVYVDGFACSIASVIAMAGDEVIMPRNTLMLIHDVWIMAAGNAVELRKAADDLDVINEAARQAYLTKAGDKLSEERLVEMMARETWLTAAQCVELGLADKVAEEDADMSGAAEALQKTAADAQNRIALRDGMAAQIRQIEPVNRAKAKTTAAEGNNSVIALFR